ncbi:MAG TPA: zf-HC2 domain-containing protein [Actinomycetes bacterium]|nr:zf-HC2 domain-containing protein [Actinomycetes bacterium]
MTCEEFGEHLTAFALGELPGDQAAAAREHLHGCSRCNNLVLRDLQLVNALRGSAVPAPVDAHRSVRAVLAAEQGRRRRRRLTRAGVVAAAAALAGVVALAGLRADRAPAPTAATRPATATTTISPISAAWQAYEARFLPIERRTGAGGPDLRPLGLRTTARGGLTLGGKAASAVDYRNARAQRLTVFRWRGQLRRTIEGGYPGTVRRELHSTRWGPTQSAWWDADGWVYCVVGNLDGRTFQSALDRIQRES